MLRRYFHRLPIRSKLRHLMAAVLATVTLLVGTADVIGEARRVRREAADELGTLARLIANTSGPALAARDRVAAQRYLDALQDVPAVMAAELRQRDATAFAAYRRAGSPPRQALVSVQQTIVIDDESVGTLVLQSDLPNLLTSTFTHGLTIVAVAGGAGLLVFFGSRHVERLITAPLLHLTSTMAWVSSNKDYSVRVAQQSSDEIGTLVSMFNEMIRKVGERDSDLAAKVAERTAALQASESRLRALIETTNDVVWEVDAQARYTYVSSRVKQILGYAPAEMIGRSIYEFVPKEEMALLEKTVSRLVAKAEPFGGLVFCNRRKDGSLVVLESNGAPYFDDLGRLCGYRGIDRDISERKAAEARLTESLRALEESQFLLQESEETLNRAQQIAHVGNWTWNIRSNALHWSDEVYRIYGLVPGTREPSQEYVLKSIHPGDRRAVDASLEAAMNGGPYKAVFRIVTEDGTVKVLESSAEVTTDAHGQPVSMIGVVQDITDRVAAEQRLTQSLLEKEVLLREIHHRVKNNMQVVSGLLELQARRVQDEQARQALRDSVNRIRSMAMIHEKLYRSEELASLDPTTYITDFTRELVGTYGSDGIRLRLEVERLPLSVDQAIPCGLILNELISNALKHGFPQGGPGTINVSLLETADGATEMSVANDGAELPADFDWERAGTLGMRLVRNLAQQLGGTLQVERLTPGTRFRLRFTRVASCSNPGS